MSKTSVLEVVSNIDWAKLREQKRWLLAMAKAGDPTPDGLIALIDELQDAAVVQGVGTELEVFNLLVEGGKTIQETYLEGKYLCKHCGSKEVSFDQGVNDAYCADCGRWQNEDPVDGEPSIEQRLKTSLTAMIAAYTGYLTVPARKKALFDARNLLESLKS